MAYTVTTKKTWARILDDIEDQLSRWGGVTSWRVDAVLAPRSSTKQYQTEAERTVTLRWTRRSTDYHITMSRQSRAVDNLLVIWLILETLRLNEARGYAEQIATVYRQEFPALPGPGGTGESVTPYDFLFVRSTAPLAVCEAAYRTLAKSSHPDLPGGGSPEYFRRITAAIEAIRKERR